MASFIAYVFLIIIVFSCIFGIGIIISAYLRHRMKKSLLTKTLLILQGFMNLFVVASLFSTVFLFFEIPIL
ncbi:MAG: hypothetical protein RBG13Loki_4331, partial [Promethearchaeota archaeon CR_4]